MLPLALVSWFCKVENLPRSKGDFFYRNGAELGGCRAQEVDKTVVAVIHFLPLCTGALSLQCMVLAALLRPISFYERLHARELATIGSHEKAAAIKDEPKVVPVLEAKYCKDSPGEDNDHKYLLTVS